MSTPTKIMHREARDEYWILIIANAMESIKGVQVLSVVFNPARPARYNEHGVWYVFARYEDDPAYKEVGSDMKTTIDDIVDDAIEKQVAKLRKGN